MKPTEQTLQELEQNEILDLGEIDDKMAKLKPEHPLYEVKKKLLAEERQQTEDYYNSRIEQEKYQSEKEKGETEPHFETKPEEPADEPTSNEPSAEVENPVQPEVIKPEGHEIEAGVQPSPESVGSGNAEAAAPVLEGQDIKQQIENFGVSKQDVDATDSLLNQVFNWLKKSGLTAAKTVGDWVGIGKGEEKPYTLKIKRCIVTILVLWNI